MCRIWKLQEKCGYDDDDEDDDDDDDDDDDGLSLPERPKNIESNSYNCR